MVQRRIGPADLVPGEPLPWDLFLADHSAGPQLRKGQIITDGAQLGAAATGSVRGYAGAAVRLALAQSRRRNAWNACCWTCAAKAMPSATCATSRATCCARSNMMPTSRWPASCSTKIATYAVRHCIETAQLLAMLVGRSMHKSDDELLLIGAAAR